MADDKESTEATLYVHGDIGPAQLNFVVPSLRGNALDGRDVSIIISTFGGSTDCALAIAIAMEEAKAKITLKTTAMGFVYSAGIYLIALGHPGYRYAYDKTVFMTHETRTAPTGTVKEVQESITGCKMVEEGLIQYFSSATGMSIAKATKWLDEVNFFTAAEAKELGLIDHIIKV